MAVPVFKWEVAFGSLPADASYTWGADISADVAANTFQRGKNSDLNQIEAGTGQLELLDDLGKYDPRNASSPYSPNVRPMVPIRQYATLDAVNYPLCVHYVEEWPRSRTAAFITRTLKTVDGFAILGTSPLAGLTIAQGITSAHVTAVLDYIGWPAGKRIIGTGSATIVEADFVATDTTQALPYLQAVTSNEAGFLYMDGAGNVVFLGRGDLLGPPFNAIQAYFSDDLKDGLLEYESSVPTYGNDRIINDWTGTRPNGGTPQQVTDATSIGQYRDRPKQVSTLLTSDADVYATMQNSLAYYAQPRERLASIVVAPGEDSAYWKAVLALDIGDRISVTETMPYGPKRTDDYLIEQVTFARGPGSDAATRITYALWPVEAAGAAGLRLDDAVLGLLGTGTLGF